MENQEIWVPVVGYEGIYEVSNIGRIKSLARVSGRGWNLKEIILKTAIHYKGYIEANLTKTNGPRKKHKVHRLMAEAFIGKSLLTVDHINGDKSDNRIENLEYVTNRENTIRYYKKNRLIKTGVERRKPGQFYASANFEGHRRYIGAYKTEDEAHEAYLNFWATHSARC